LYHCHANSISVHALPSCRLVSSTLHSRHKTWTNLVEEAFWLSAANALFILNAI
jgi:hypothetical protein